MAVAPTTAEDVQKAAVHVADRWGFVFGVSALDLEYGISPSWWIRFRIRRQQRRIDRFRRWLADVEDPVLRDAYAVWVDHAERRCDEAREELQTGQRRREFKERVRTSEGQTTRNVRLSRRLPQPLTMHRKRRPQTMPDTSQRPLGRCEALNAHIGAAGDQCALRAVAVVDCVPCCRRHGLEFQREAYFEGLARISTLPKGTPLSRAMALANAALDAGGGVPDRDPAQDRPWRSFQAGSREA